MSNNISDAAVRGFSPAQADRLLTVAEVSEMTGYSQEWTRKAIWRGDLKAFQTGGRGGRIRVPLSAVYEWLGHSAAHPSRPALEDIDWAEPAEYADPSHDLVICDAYTDYIPVHASRLSEFYAAKTEQGR